MSWIEMPYCTLCQSWFPRSASECGDCGGALAPPLPASDEAAPTATGHGPDRVQEMVEDAFSKAILPDHDSKEPDPADVQQLVSAFDAVRRRASGRHAAPLSWLPAEGARVASALDVALAEAEEEGDWPATRGLREAILDLQAFLPDDEAVAAEATASRQERTGPGDDAGTAALDRVTWSQALVVSMLRNDERVLGAHNALAEIDIVIGQAQRSLEAVDRYKEAQVSGIAALVYWPLGLMAGLVLGTLIASFSVVATAVVGMLVIAGWTLGLGPRFGWTVGAISSRIDRLAMRADRPAVVRVGRWVATGVWVVLFLGIPPVTGLVITLGCQWLGLP